MEIYDTIGWIFISVCSVSMLFTGLDIRPILAILWGIFLVWNY